MTTHNFITNRSETKFKETEHFLTKEKRFQNVVIRLIPVLANKLKVK